MRRHCELQRRLLNYTDTFLTTAVLARYVLKQIDWVAGVPLNDARVLIFTPTTVSGESWAAGLLYHGLRSLLGDRMSSWLGRVPSLYADFPVAPSHVPPRRLRGNRSSSRLASQPLYGFGFSWARRLPTPSVEERCGRTMAARLQHELMQHRLREGYFNVLIIATCSNRQCNLDECYGAGATRAIETYVWRHAETTSVVTLDGNDLFAPHNNRQQRPLCHTTFAEQLPFVDVHFLREVDGAASSAARHVRVGEGVPEEWLREKF